MAQYTNGRGVERALTEPLSVTMLAGDASRQLPPEGGAKEEARRLTVVRQPRVVHRAGVGFLHLTKLACMYFQGRR